MTRTLTLPCLDTLRLSQSRGCAWTFSQRHDGMYAVCATPHSFLLDANDGNGFTPVCRAHLPAATRWAFNLTPGISNSYRNPVRILPADQE